MLGGESGTMVREQCDFKEVEGDRDVTDKKGVLPNAASKQSAIKFSFSKNLLPDSSNWLVWCIAAYMLVVLIFLDANPEMMLVGYFMETILIGFIYVIKMGFTIQFDRPIFFRGFAAALGHLFVIVFFVFHYYLFVGIQSIFIFSFFSDFMSEMRSERYIIENYLNLLNDRDVQITVGGLFAFHLIALAKDFIFPRIYLKADVKALMLEPYSRIMVQQIVVILTGFLFLLLHPGIAAGILLIAVKTYLDLHQIDEGRVDQSKIGIK